MPPDHFAVFLFFASGIGPSSSLSSCVLVIMIVAFPAVFVFVFLRLSHHDRSRSRRFGPNVARGATTHGNGARRRPTDIAAICNHAETPEQEEDLDDDADFFVITSQSALPECIPGLRHCVLMHVFWACGRVLNFL